MQVKRIAECSFHGAFCNTYDLHEATICHKVLRFVYFQRGFCKHLCVLIYIRIKGEICTIKHFTSSSNFLNDCSKAVLLLMLWILFCYHKLCFTFLSFFAVLSAPCSLVSYQLGKGWPLDSLVCCIFLCFVISHMVSHFRCGT